MLLSRSGSYGRIGRLPTSVGNFSGQTFNLNITGTDTRVQYMYKVGEKFFYTIEPRDPGSTTVSMPRGTITMSTGLDILDSFNYTESTGNFYAVMNQVDSNNNYCGILTRNYGLTDPTVPAKQSLFPAQFDSTGNVTLATQFTVSGENLSRSRTFFTTNDFTTYLTSSVGTSGNVGTVLTKIDSSHSISYSKQYNYGATFSIIKIYVGDTGTYNIGLSNSGYFLMKTDSNGTILWTIVLSSNRNIYDLVEYNSYLYCAGGNGFLKIDASNGSVLINKSYATALESVTFTTIRIFNDHILTVGYGGASNNVGTYLGEFDAVGNMVWINKFSYGTGSTFSYGLTAFASTSVIIHDSKFIVGMQGPYNTFQTKTPALIFNFPTNGTLPFSGDKYISGLGCNVAMTTQSVTASTVSLTTSSIVPTVTTPSVSSSNVTSSFTKASVPNSTWNYVKY